MAHEQILHHRGNYLVRRLQLPPGHATPWHRDRCHRVTVVLSGDILQVEFRDGAETERFAITVGEAHWLEPSDRVHRAVNVGTRTYEEVTTFFLERPDASPQPQVEEP
ncbi:MAG: hypothetical protein JO033_03830 [Acidobacteriaceae bacterium]|nr:hypothetical protein [Acidobacteriaceae bacterium]MBV9502460.1 hypothetical protein [Acidobacteriaceae bacterium]